MRPCRTSPRLIAAVVVAAGTSASADAAVRRCAGPVASDITEAPNEQLGRRQALAGWSARVVKQHGAPFANWRLADRRQLKCVPAKAPALGVQCAAAAVPCRIDQVPGTPQGPGRRPRRAPPGSPIET